MTDRKFLGKKLDVVALSYNPHLCSLDEFAEDMIGSIDNWCRNMKGLGMNKNLYPEQWMETFLAWAEFNTTDE